MKEIKIVSRWDSSKVLICGKYESIKDCLEKNRGTDLWDADLRGANLGDANLWGADLGNADLGNVILGDADLVGADLRGANLWGANLQGADLQAADLRGANLGGANLWGADLRGANLGDANLWGVTLGTADLWDANLGGANLWGADLGGAKNYYQSHDFAQELIRRNNNFTDEEWSFIGECLVHRFCYDIIKKDYLSIAIAVFKKLDKMGYGEYLKELTKWEIRGKTFFQDQKGD